MKIFIDSEFITLTQFLKITGLISTGGEAKIFLLETKVYLNGELETRRGKKLYNGDKIGVKGKEYEIVEKI